MFTSIVRRSGMPLHFPQLCRGLALVSLLLAGVCARSAFAKDDWLPISDEDRTSLTPQIDPNAAGEVLYQRSDVDYRGYPTDLNQTEYIRIKVFKPELVERLTRISGREITDDLSETRVKLRARVTLPNGTTKELGEDAIRERTLSQTGERTLLNRLLGTSGAQTRERFLAVSGVEPGAIIEYQVEYHVTSRRYSRLRMNLLQRPHLPVRRIEMTVHTPVSRDWAFRCFVLNADVAPTQIKELKKNESLLVTASNIPAIAEDPLSGPSPAYHALAIVTCFDRVNAQALRRHDRKSYFVDGKKTGPWSVVAVGTFSVINDYVEVTPKVRQLAGELTASVQDSREKAARIHRKVQELSANFTREAKFNKTTLDADSFIRSPDPLLNYTRKSQVAGVRPEDFIALEISLCQAAGLEAQAILLPDRRYVPFSRGMVSGSFVPHLAVGIHLDNEWVLSAPTFQPALPLGMVPWYCEGQVGLWVKEGKEEFLSVRLQPSSGSLSANGGTFVLSPDGTLSGEAKRKLTGHSAYVIREKLLNRDEAKQKQILAQQIASALNVAVKERPAKASDDDEEAADAGGNIVITGITGVDDPGAPLEITYKLNVPNFASILNDRIIFRSAIFRTNPSSPFTAEKRTTRVFFPYAWQELDNAVIRVPDGYEAKFAETALPDSGQALHFQSTVSFDPSKQQLKIRREFASSLLAVPVETYPALKAWYDGMVAADQKEVILVRTPADGSAPVIP